MKVLAAAFCLAIGMSSSVVAQGAALVIGNEDYRRISDLRRADELVSVKDALERQDITVFAKNDASTEDVGALFEAFSQAVPRSERLLVVLAGRFVHSETDTYFLPTDMGPEPLAVLSRQALPLTAVLAYLATTPGQSVLALVTDTGTGAYSPLVQFGVGELDIPQGVTVIRGLPRPMTRYISRTLVRPGGLVGSASTRTFEISGYNAKGQTFVPAPPPEPVAAATETPAPAPQDNRLADLLAWRQADRANTAQGYEAYIDANPSGQFVLMAQNRIRSLTDTPEARAERAEQALDLNREQRRQIQRDLSLLGFNTRGIDGIFGNGTRAAIAGWQKSNQLTETGYFNADQLTTLGAQAARRAAELEAEAEKRRQERLAQDRAFWNQTGAIGDEAGFRVYLERFPDGEFSEVARARLEDIERQKRRQTDARDRNLWDQASQINSIRAYEDYLALAPGGAFRDEAEDRIAVLRQAQNDSAVNDRAARQEQAMNLNAATRRVIESRLNRLGLKPGNVDGTFDDNTRRAIRRYQQARNLPETGYLNDAVVVRLLADSVRSVFR